MRPPYQKTTTQNQTLAKNKEQSNICSHLCGSRKLQTPRLSPQAFASRDAREHGRGFEFPMGSGEPGSNAHIRSDCQSPRLAELRLQEAMPALRTKHVTDVYIYICICIYTHICTDTLHMCTYIHTHVYSQSNMYEEKRLVICMHMHLHNYEFLYV